ncbi:MAG: hypothetical protein WBC78_22050 [Candidatus Sulfotelmatobacter sp.]
MSNRIVKRIRSALLLPVLHLLIVAFPMFRRAQMLWDYIPTAQRAEDYERDHPPTDASGDYKWNCYEYRMSTNDRLIVSAELPAAILVGYDQECWPAIIRSTLYRLLKYHVRVSSRLIGIDCLLLAGVFGQWLLIGRWLDFLDQGSRPRRQWIIPVAVVTLGGVAMVPGVFLKGGMAEHGNIIVGFVSLLAWLALLLMFTAAGIKGIAKTLRRAKHAD